ncbi:MAG TPA: peptidyl-prolyl cis-trans isomerase [Thermoanaerobaculia bacterium]|nr:peptidyl-prolyl cis-trans isomerase [Thermoanaerobaculia bacterium]
MLKVLRDNLKYLSWILWLVIVVFVIFVFADFGGGISRGNGVQASYAAKVDGAEIPIAEFQRSYRALEDQMRELYGDRYNADVARQMQLPMQALDRLVARRVLVREAERLGLRPSDDEVRAEILQIGAFATPDGGFVGDQEYADILRRNGQTVAAFERSLREDLAVQKLTSALAQAARVSDAEVERSYRQEAEQVGIRYVLLPAGRFTEQVTATPEAVRAYFEAHPQEFQLAEQRVVDYLLVDALRMSAALEVPDTEARAYYDAQQEEFTRPEQVRASHILLKVDEKRPADVAQRELQAVRRRVEAGEDFAALAQQLSEDPGSQPRGGDLGFFGRGQMIPEFEEAAFSAQPGQLVGPIQTDFGYHLIRVEERRAGGVAPFDEVKAQIVSRLRQERALAAAEAKAKEVHAQLAAKEVVTRADLEALAAAESSSLSLQTTPAFGADDPVPGIGRGTPFSAAAFALGPGKVGEPQRTPRGWAIPLLNETKPPRLPEFAEAEAKARQAVEREQREARALRELEAARSKVSGGKALDEVAKELGVEVRDSGEFGASGVVTGLGVAPELARAALALEVGGVGGPIATAQGPVLFQVSIRRHFDPIEFAAKKVEARAELEREAVNRLLLSLIEKRRQELEVEYNRELLEQVGALPEEQAG